jgi:hypothetical protein
VLGGDLNGHVGSVCDDMQFAFTPVKGTADAIFVARQVQENHLAKKKNLY